MGFGKSAVELAAELATGSITAEAIKSQYGDSILGEVLGEVLAIGGGLVAAGATSMLLEVVDRNTGIVSDIGGVIDDIFSF